MEHGHTTAEVRRRLAHRAPTLHLRDAVYGGIDGAVTTLAIVAGAAGAGVSSRIVLALGIANVLADGFSMAAGNFVSARAERDNVRRLRAMERRHVRDHPDGERLELTEILAAKGLSGEPLAETVRAICQSDRLWIDLMLVEEHGVSPIESRALPAALVTFVAFVVAGLVPLAPFLVGAPHPLGLSIVVTAFVFVLIGALRGRFSLTSSWRTAFETLAIGATAGVVAWGASVAVERLGG